MVSYDEARKVLERHRRELFQITGVVSVGLSMRNGQPIIFVSAFPGTQLPASIEGIPVIVETVRRPPSFLEAAPAIPFSMSPAVYSSRYRPIPLGVSIGTAFQTGSVGGYIVIAGSTYLVTVGHLFSQLGQPVYQPSPLDAVGGALDRIGILEKWGLEPGRQLKVDGALVKLDSPSLAASITPEGIPVTKIGQPYLGQKVYKIGRTTGITASTVYLTDVTTLVEGVGYLDGLIATAENITELGDSGGPLLDASTHALLGLASARGEGRSYFTPFTKILEAFGLPPNTPLAPPIPLGPTPSEPTPSEPPSESPAAPGLVSSWLVPILVALVGAGVGMFVFSILTWRK